MGLKGVVQLERNDKVTHGGKYKSYDLLPTLHIHLITTREQLEKNPQVTICHYQHKKELRAKHKEHITATPLYYTEGVINYLTKQYEQGLTPFGFSVSTPIYKETKQMRNTKEKNPQIAIWLLQMLMYNSTYAEVKQQRYNLNKELLTRSLYAEVKHLYKHLMTNDDIYLITCKNKTPIKVVQVKPNPPNKQTNANLC